MPLSQRVVFKTYVAKKSRVKIPVAIRQKFKLEPSEPLNVTVSSALNIGLRECFFTKMRKDGYITIPQVNAQLLKGNRPNLEKLPVEITLEPE